MGVSAQYINKIVKGSENLSLETISKIERALNIRLIEVPGFSSFKDDESFHDQKGTLNLATEPPARYPKTRKSDQKPSKEK